MTVDEGRNQELSEQPLRTPVSGVSSALEDEDVLCQGSVPEMAQAATPALRRSLVYHKIWWCRAVHLGT
jgi:hypothetical protein